MLYILADVNCGTEITPFSIVMSLVTSPLWRATRLVLAFSQTIVGLSPSVLVKANTFFKSIVLSE